MDLEDICVQLKNRYRDRDVEFQGRLVRLNKRDSVCRQLYDIWLDTSDREATYEDFKRSLRFDREGGRVEVKFAYDPTKFVVAGLAGIGATAAAAGGYQWWKSRKKSAGVAGPPGSPNGLVKPSTSTWGVFKIDSKKKSSILSALKELNDDGEIQVNMNEVVSGDQIRQLFAGQRLLTDKDGELKFIEDAIRTINSGYGGGSLFEVGKYRLVTDAIVDTRIDSITDQQDSKQTATKLSRPDYVTTEGANQEVKASNLTFDNKDAAIDVVLADNPDICDQIKNVIEKGSTYTVGTLADHKDLFYVKSRRTTKYKIPSSTKHFSVRIHDPNNVQQATYNYCDSIDLVNQGQFRLVRVMFTGAFAYLIGNDWIYVEIDPPGDWVERLEILKKSIPENNLSNVKAIPKFMQFKRK